MTNLFAVEDTVTLIKAVELMKPKATYLLDRYFSQKMPVAKTSWVGLEYKKGKRLLAPYVVSGSRGAVIGRDSAEARFYSAPMIGGLRIISVKELEMRQFGEQPLYSALTAEERQAEMQGRDLRELKDMLSNRRNQMAAELLQTGKVRISGYADDGVEVVEDEIDYNWSGLRTPPISWDNSNAHIYQDLKDAVESIAESTGVFPTLMICGKNIEKYLLNNKEIKEWLEISNRTNWTMASFAPRYVSPQTRYIGQISALGLEIHSYLESYTDDGGQLRTFIDADTAIISTADIGKQMYGAVTFIDRQSGARTYAAEEVPIYTINEESQQMSLGVYSRTILVPNDVESWITIKAK